MPKFDYKPLRLLDCIPDILLRVGVLELTSVGRIAAQKLDYAAAVVSAGWLGRKAVDAVLRGVVLGYPVVVIFGRLVVGVFGRLRGVSVRRSVVVSAARVGEDVDLDSLGFGAGAWRMSFPCLRVRVVSCSALCCFPFAVVFYRDSGVLSFLNIRYLTDNNPFPCNAAAGSVCCALALS